MTERKKENDDANKECLEFGLRRKGRERKKERETERAREGKERSTESKYS